MTEPEQPFPQCAETCELIKVLGVGECENVPECAHKFAEPEHTCGECRYWMHDSDLAYYTGQAHCIYNRKLKRGHDKACEAFKPREKGDGDATLVP